MAQLHELQRQNISKSDTKTCMMDQVVIAYFMEELRKTTKWTYQSQDTHKILLQILDR